MRLGLSAKAAKQLGGRYAPKTDEEKAAERAERERQRQEKLAQERVEREEKERARVAFRERTKAERSEADKADKVLSGALSDYHTIESAIDTKQREKARADVEKAKAEVHASEQAILAAQRRLAEAQREYKRLEERHEAMESLSLVKLPEAKAVLRAAWGVNDAAWRRVTPQYRKASRDRALKNAVKDVLGLAEETD